MNQHQREKSEPSELNNGVPFSITALIAVLTIWSLIYIFWSHNKVNAGSSETLVASENAVKQESEAENSVQEVATIKPSSANVASTRSYDGKKSYEGKCAACHQKTGAGIPGAFPPITGSEWVVEDPNLAISIILKGLSGSITVKGEEYNSVMPGFENTMSSEEIAAVVNYIRGNLGNSANPIDVDMVVNFKEKVTAQKAPWNGGAAVRDSVK